MDNILGPPLLEESARTTGHRSARNTRVEIITRGERRRSWTAEQKCLIVAESFGPELTPAEVVRKHAISSGQLYTWRRQFVGAPSALVTRSAPQFAEVEVTGTPLPEVDDPAFTEASAPPSAPSPLRPGGLIEVVLRSGVIVRLDARVDASALRRVLAALEER